MTLKLLAIKHDAFEHGPPVRFESSSNTPAIAVISSCQPGASPYRFAVVSFVRKNELGYQYWRAQSYNSNGLHYLNVIVKAKPLLLDAHWFQALLDIEPGGHWKLIVTDLNTDSD